MKDVSYLLGSSGDILGNVFSKRIPLIIKEEALIKHLDGAGISLKFLLNL